MLLLADTESENKFFFQNKPTLKFLLIPSLFARSLLIGRKEVITFEETLSDGKVKLKAKHNTQ